MESKTLTLHETDVLIVGAGPTGLAMAAALAKESIRFRIIDSNLQRSSTSKALGVQAGTLEAIEDVFGSALASLLLQAGQMAKNAFLHFADLRAVQIHLDQLESRFNGILILEQSETERIFEELLRDLGSEVERGATLAQLTVEPSTVLCEVRNRSGISDLVRAKYVVGCDGSHSKVREAAGIKFRGSSYTGDFLLGDVHIQWPFSHGDIRAFSTDQGAMACFPMKGDSKYRIVMVLPERSEDGGAELTLAELQENANRLAPQMLILSKPVWLSRFRVHHRIAENFRRGSIFLAGDAAHIHSPAGGQGMNTGIQDALNLASKIALVIHKKAPLDLLDDYEIQRIPIAKSILRGTDFVFQNLLLSRSLMARTLRHQILPKIVKLPALQKRVIHAVSELNVARHEIKIRKQERARSFPP